METDHTVGSTDSRKRIAYVGPFRFPDDSAMSQRVLGIASTLHCLGHEVLVGAGQYEPESVTTPYARSLPFAVVALQERPPKGSSVFGKAKRIFSWGARTLAWLDAIEPRPDVILLYESYYPRPYWQRILPWCRKHRIPLVVDAVEWYEPSHLQGGRFGMARWMTEVSLRFGNVKAGNIIAISRYLQDYYLRRGCHVIRIPPILNVSAVSPRIEANAGPLTMAYAGMPGKKDLLDNVVEAVLQIDSTGRSIRLSMAGPRASDILRLPALRKRRVRSLPDCLHAAGPLPHSSVVDMVRKADFVPLLRPPLRYAQAGFPTKVPESFSVGTPVICNVTSDLGHHVRDGQEGIICRDHSATAFAEGLDRALSLTARDRAKMRQAARVEAERSFDYLNYVEPLGAFLGALHT